MKFVEDVIDFELCLSSEAYLLLVLFVLLMDYLYPRSGCVHCKINYIIKRGNKY